MEYPSFLAELPGHSRRRLGSVKTSRMTLPLRAIQAGKVPQQRCVQGVLEGEAYHRTTDQRLELGDYHGRDLRLVIRHLVGVALAHILAVFMTACLPGLKKKRGGKNGALSKLDMRFLRHQA